MCEKSVFRPTGLPQKRTLRKSMVDRKPFVACGFCGAKISFVIGYHTINKHSRHISGVHGNIISAVTGQVKRLIGFKRILSSQEHRRFNSNRPFPSSRVLRLRNESKCVTLHIKISPHAVSISCKPKSKEWFRT